MLKKDQEALCSLIKEYSVEEVLASLVSATRECRDESSDLGLKDKAKYYAEWKDILTDFVLGD